MSKIVYQALDRKTVISEHGEVKHQEVESHSIKRISSYEQFMQVYLEDVAVFHGLTQATEFKVLLHIWKLASFNPQNKADGNLLILIKSVKQQIAEEIGLSYGTVDNTINRLAKKDFLIKRERSVYYLNPEICFKGCQDDRPKVIKKILEYRIEAEQKKNPNQIDMFEDQGGNVRDFNSARQQREEEKRQYAHMKIAAE